MGNGTNGYWPVRVSADGMPRADLGVRPTWAGTYNASIDLWLSTYPDKTTQAGGAEIMIWLSHPIFAHTTPVSSAKGLRLNSLFRMAESRGWLRSPWYWTWIDAGFELRNGGRGPGVSYFNMDT